MTLSERFKPINQFNIKSNSEFKDFLFCLFCFSRKVLRKMVFVRRCFLFSSTARAHCSWRDVFECGNERPFLFLFITAICTWVFVTAAELLLFLFFLFLHFESLQSLFLRHYYSFLCLATSFSDLLLSGLFTCFVQSEIFLSLTFEFLKEIVFLTTTTWILFLTFVRTACSQTFWSKFILQPRWSREQVILHLLV